MTDLIRHEKLDNGIHEFVTLANNRATVDAFFDAISEATANHPKDQTFRYITDMTKNEMPPFAYFIEKNRAWVAANPNLPPSRMAILLPMTNPFRSLIFSLLPVILRGAQRPLKASIFLPEERDKAIFWLLTDS